MFYLLLTLSGLILLIWAPLNIILLTGSILILIPSVVRYSTTLLTGFDISFGEAFKAVALSLLLPSIALLWLVSATGHIAGASGDNIEIGGPIISAGLFAAYALGYKVSLGIPFKASMMVALVSTLLSIIALLFIRSVI